MNQEELRAQAIAELEPTIAEMIATKQTAIKEAAVRRVTDLEEALAQARAEAAAFEPVVETAQEVSSEPQG